MTTPWRNIHTLTFTLMGLLFAGDMAVPFALGPSYPDYSHLHDTLSTLGSPNSPVAALTGAWLVLFGVVLTALSIVEWRLAAPGRRAAAYCLGLLAFAVGAGIVAGLFPEDALGTAETVSGKVHGVGAGLGSIGLLVGLVFGAGLLRGQARILAYALALLAWVSFAVFLSTKAPGAYAGLWQKMYLGSAYAAVLVIAASLRSRRVSERD